MIETEITENTSTEVTQTVEVTEVIEDIENTDVANATEVITSSYIDYTPYLQTINYNIVSTNVMLFVVACIVIIVVIYNWIQSLF